jgi:hypothetical protein
MSWDQTQQYRLAMEQAILRSELPAFTFHDPTGKTYVSGQWTSNKTRAYGLRVELSAGFPDECPNTYITSPSPLRGYSATLESYGTSHAMHTWETDHPGWTKVCIYQPSDWSAAHTIAKVLRKAMLWITAYECHLASGKDICAFLL